MADLPCTFEQIQHLYSKEIEKIVETLRASRSKYRLTRPEKLVWFFSVAWRCDEPYLGSLSDANSLYLWELGRVIVHLTAAIPTKHNAWRGSAEIQIPAEVKDYLIQRCQKSAEEHRAFEALSPEERDSRFRAALGVLRKSPGFMELSIHSGGKEG